ncbi:hypothetical protein H5392_00555 [Tessaracoccus sp. MC1865]|uniref:hypothetical protein n=1 Tax=Tessaracoccus sp. MC1865 TaxID=2760310 RepID=UPI00160220B4|nr:hypothetical protein [Tessaracoccus sp. MC1865]MBB1482349.1 hypothetical protein [Tessaracoccus sp. MC1865]QTO38183.1 hypothetical protein J7D54_03525 [Tessaracoccus sp. MC1865]
MKRVNEFRDAAAQCNASEDRLNQAWKGVPRALEEVLAHDKFVEAFHEAWDAAVPESSLHGGDPKAVEEAIRFLEADARFFRSGYIKADLCNQLKRLSLSEEDRQRLRRVILAVVQDRRPGIRRETRHFGRLAAVVADAALIAALVAYIRSGVAPQDRRAWLILDSYHSAVGAPARDREPLGKPRRRS